ncbi:MAG: SRPBCC domain-containing protein [Gemmatimonadaceae bacterium]|nr:SRPBCC domain-containing protein [Gemmatimonadaceae bacterium]
MKHSGNLTVTMPSDREITMTRVFDAPRHLVYDAYTKPELIRRWLGIFGEWKFRICDIDLRVGGTYRYVWDGPNGQTLGIHGVYREIVTNERLVVTERFGGEFDQGEESRPRTADDEAPRARAPSGGSPRPGSRSSARWAS